MVGVIWGGGMYDKRFGDKNTAFVARLGFVQMCSALCIKTVILYYDT